MDNNKKLLIATWVVMAMMFAYIIYIHIQVINITDRLELLIHISYDHFTAIIKDIETLWGRVFP